MVSPTPVLCRRPLQRPPPGRGLGREDQAVSRSPQPLPPDEFPPGAGAILGPAPSSTVSPPSANVGPARHRHRESDGVMPVPAAPAGGATGLGFWRGWGGEPSAGPRPIWPPGSGGHSASTSLTAAAWDSPRWSVPSIPASPVPPVASHFPLETLGNITQVLESAQDTRSEETAKTQ